MNYFRFVIPFALTVSLLLLPCPGYSATRPDPASEQALDQGADLLAGKRVMVLGDSITQGGGYVTFIEYLLEKQNPTLDFDIISVGLSSETTSGLSEEGHAGGRFPRPCLHERLDRALAAVKPELVIACYGMNDGIYLPYGENRMEAFRGGITHMVEKCNAAGAQVILVTPPVFDSGRANPDSYADYDTVLAKFAQWEVNSPPRGVLAVADLHTPMAEALAERQKKDPAYYFARDGVHPNELGHLIMALSILHALKIETPPGRAEELLAVIQKDPLLPLVRDHRKTRSGGWLPYIGYTRERHVAPGTGDIAKVEAEAARIQQQVDAMRRK